MFRMIADGRASCYLAAMRCFTDYLPDQQNLFLDSIAQNTICMWVNVILLFILSVDFGIYYTHFRRIIILSIAFYWNKKLYI